MPDAAGWEGKGQFGADGGDGLLEAGVRGDGGEKRGGRAEGGTENGIEGWEKREVKVRCAVMGERGAGAEGEDEGNEEGCGDKSAGHAQTQKLSKCLGF